MGPIIYWRKLSGNESNIAASSVSLQARLCFQQRRSGLAMLRIITPSKPAFADLLDRVTAINSARLMTLEDRIINPKRG